MKKLYFILLILCISCNSEDANDCFQTSGNIISEEISVTSFSKIEVGENITLVIKEGERHQVTVETGSNLLNDVDINVVGETLFLRDTNNCNYFRDYGVTIIHVTAPNIIEIVSKTQFEVRSDGILTFPILKLISENFTNDSAASGNFILQVQNQELQIVFNNLSNLFILGSTDDFIISFPGGNSRIEAADFMASKVIISSRGSNDIIINPQRELRGDIYGTGDVIAVNRPPIVEFIAHYTGQLVFN
ncbi:putative auto-transporter adhesin, head GIN domain [Kordia sp. SMS9]|uniref:head GIN domain-containing protein n=1 Tax=Kordia sp. SMS9 TaxID=2282170 RepID=UPI000E0CEF18|nr:head GIN domain-containing protein [Kordia sp. SMS9]AXG68064.1 putative auto-transporter adhesin, head GIN domain [Kordia sp. SMS9]